MGFASAFALPMRDDRPGPLETASDRATDAWRDADSEFVDRVEDGWL